MALTACVPPNTFKARKFGGELTFIEALPKPNFLAAPAEIARAVQLKAVEQYTTPKQIEELNQLVEDARNEDFVFTDMELDYIDNARTDNFVPIENGKSIYPRLRPLISGKLYQIEIVREGGRVAIPGLVMRAVLTGTEIVKPGSPGLTPTPERVLSAIQKDLYFKAIRIYGRPEVITISAEVPTAIPLPSIMSPREILISGTIDMNGNLNAIARGTLQGMGLDRISTVEPKNIFENILLKKPVELSISNDPNVVGDFKVEVQDNNLTEDYILDLEKLLEVI